MTIVSLSVSYRTAPIEVLERLAVPSGQLSELLARLPARPSIQEVAVLATCNRFEVYAAVRGPVEDAVQTLLDVLAMRARLAVGEAARMANVRVGEPAVEHLFSVACGLESMAVGEEQIVAQIKAAIRAATASGTAGSVIGGLIDAALRVSKRARTETAVSTAGISLVRAGLDLAKTHLGGLAGLNAVVVGTGSTGRLAARLLREADVGQLTIAGRNTTRAAAVADAVRGRPVRIVDLPDRLMGADVVIAATGSAETLVTAEHLRMGRERVGARPLFVLDLGRPADIDPAIGWLAGVELVDLSSLGRHLADREGPGQLSEARAIVATAASAYMRRQERAVAGPVIAAMHAQFTKLAEAELAGLHYRLATLGEDQRTETVAIVHRILHKALHRPIIRARDLATDPDGPVYLEALRRLFDVNPHANGDAA